jgi:hypothetical protein
MQQHPENSLSMLKFEVTTEADINKQTKAVDVILSTKTHNSQPSQAQSRTSEMWQM